MNLSPETFEHIREHFTSVYPKEGCGLVLTDGSFIPCDNVAEDPSKDFTIEDDIYALHEENIASIVHSHCFAGAYKNYQLDPRTPSGADIQGHISTGVPWGITHCDGENIEEFIWLGESHLIPLVGRDFIHGFTDCYSACRDWYKVECNLTIPEFPRDMNWWVDESKNLYIDGFHKAGFEVIAEEDATVGDAILFRIASRQPNHAGVIVADGQVFHHLFGNLSNIENYHKYRKGIICFLRHNTLNQNVQPELEAA